jgi:hypothetical protein
VTIARAGEFETHRARVKAAEAHREGGKCRGFYTSPCVRLTQRGAEPVF